MIAFNAKIRVRFYVVTVALLVAAVVLFAATTYRSVAPKRDSSQHQKVLLNPAIATAGTPAVVELFTSEGCSSCPAADELVATAQVKYDSNVIVLSYHVDYWDRLGWKDPFSQSIFSDRQKQYARQFNLQSVYTPQAVINGQLQFVGSNKQQLYDAIEGGGNAANSSIIKVENITVQNNQLVLTYHHALIKSTEEILIELVLKKASTQVKRGENGGSLLHHINVVTGLSRTQSSNGTLAFKLPPAFNKSDYQVVAFVQDKSTGAITGATKFQIR